MATVRTPDVPGRLERLLAPRGPAVVLVEGRAGTGKTWLVQGLLDQPAVADRHLVTVAFPSAGPPVLHRSRSAPDVTAADAELEALLDVEEPALLIAEDVHRADDAARAVLRRLLAHPPARLVAVLTYRPEELARPGLPLGAAVDHPPGTDVRRIRLAPLDAEQVRGLAIDALGEQRCPAQFTTRLYELSGGVAQVVADLLRLVDDGGPRERFTARDAEAAPVPVRLAELALARMHALPEHHGAIVEAAAVLEEPCTEAELIKVAGLSEADGRQALLAALATAALDECPGGTYGFLVPLAARAVYEVLPGPLRHDLHRRAGELLAARQPVPWVRLARHQRGSGDPAGWLASVEAAARQAAEAGEHQAAISLLENALADPAVDPATRGRLAPMLARSASVGLRSDQTVRVLRRVVDDPELPPEVRGGVRLDLALVLGNQVGHSAQGRAELERAVHELRDQPAPAARAMSALAMPYWPSGTLAENLDWLRQAESVAARSRDRVVQAAVAANRVAILLSVGDPRGWQLIEQLPEDSDDPACLQHVARGLCNAADAAVWLGEYRRAADLLARGVDLSVRSGQAFAEQTGLATRLLLDWVRGRWDDLPARAREFVAMTGTMPWVAADAHLVLGMLALARGEWSQVTAWLSGSGLPDPADGAVPLVAAAAGARVRLALARQDGALAAAESIRAWERLRAKGVWVWAAEPAPWLVEAMVGVGELDVARDMVTEFAAGLTRRQSPVAEAALEWCHGILAEAAGRPEAAVAHFRRAGDAFADLPRPYEAALAEESAGRCALAAGIAENAAAVDELKAAESRLEELGAVWDAARVRATLRSYQVEERRPPGRPAYGDQLSPREQEVAELAGSGLTNREIATTLHLSPRTVEQHVARVLRKLGVQSRQDLADGRR